MKPKRAGGVCHFIAGNILLDAALAVVLTFATAVPAQIPVEAGGVAPIAFNTTPPASEFATGVLTGGAPTYNSTATMDAGVQSINVANIVRTLPTDGTVPPVSFSGGFRHNTTAFYLQSRPTTDNTNAAGILVARLQNLTGANVIAFTVSYDFAIYNPGTGEIPGFRVFYSTTGTPGTWQLIPSLSSTEVAGTHAADISSIAWAPGALFYLLWADDNANSITDPSYTIDNFSITSVFVEAVGPTCVAFTNQPSSLTVGEGATASFTVGATGSPQHIQWYRNGTPLPGANGLRYTTSPVLYLNDNGAQFHAIVSNSVCIATSTIATLTVIADTNAPTLVSAVGETSLTTVSVTFSEPIFDTGNLEPQFIVFPRNSDFQSGAELLTAAYTMTNGNRTVILTVNPPRAFGSNYSVYVVDVFDTSSAQNLIQPNPTIVPIAATVQLIGFDTDNAWKYSIGHTATSNLHGTGWEQAGYDDSTWLSGPAGLGRDTGQPNGVPIRTPLPYTTDPTTALNVTTYFRRQFFLPSTTNGVILSLRDVVEDGAVYYLNGKEVFRNRMPSGPVSFTTETPSASEPQSISGPFDLAITNLWPGRNVLAAEVHQNGPDSSDLEFAAELMATIPVFSQYIASPLNIVRNPATGLITIRWTGGGVLEAAPDLQNMGTNWTVVPGNSNPYTFMPAPATRRFFRLRP